MLLTAQQGVLQWGLWVNTQKNPRFKSVEMSGLGIAVEIPKQLALASIALRVQVGRPQHGVRWHMVLGSMCKPGSLAVVTTALVALSIRPGMDEKTAGMHDGTMCCTRCFTLCCAAPALPQLQEPCQ